LQLKGIEITDNITLGDAKPNIDVPYRFEGKNLNEYIVKVRPHPRCGCTSGQKEFEVAPGAEFAVEGNLMKRDQKGGYSKHVDLYFRAENRDDKESMIRLTFSGTIV